MVLVVLVVILVAILVTPEFRWAWKVGREAHGRRRWSGTRIKGGSGWEAGGALPISHSYRSHSAPDRNSVKTNEHILLVTYWDQPPQMEGTLKDIK